MIFNSLVFFVFIGIFFPLYFLLKGKARLWLSLIASLIFYGWWDWRFLSLVAFSTIVDYVAALLLGQTEDSKKRYRLLLVSMAINLGFLGFFKYFNFFIESFAGLLESCGMNANIHSLNIILPVGISFYTFQSMSYTIDVYQRKIPVEKDFIRFATFITFFPQLVAGPIVRASDFLPQFQKDREFEWNRVIAGTSQVLWGFFKKVAIADSLAPFVDQCFDAPGGFSSLHLLIGVFFYSFQIYCDFSGYSDIAIGLARILGFDFPQNFRTPYFSMNFSEFWKRWHISLSSWLQDYLYIPLGGNRSGSFGSWFFTILSLLMGIVLTGWWWLMVIYALVSIITYFWLQKSPDNKRTMFTYMNLVITMLLGGLWHGANWTFVMWGFLHGFYLVVQRFFGPYWNRLLTTLRIPLFLQNGIAVGMVYFATCFAWIYFRSSNFDIANQVINGISSMENFNFGSVVNKFWVIKGFLLIGILVLVEFIDVYYRPLYREAMARPIFRVVSFATLLWLIAFFGSFGANSFIYFQF